MKPPQPCFSSKKRSSRVASLGFEWQYRTDYQSVAYILMLVDSLFFQVNGLPGIRYWSNFEQQREGNLSPFVTYHQRLMETLSACRNLG
jgi:hypothetical protein